MSVFRVVIYVRQTSAPVTPTSRNLIDALRENTVAYLCPFNCSNFSLNTQLIEVTCFLRGSCRVHKHFRGNAPNIQARSAESATIYKRDFFVIPFRSYQGVPRSRADDDKVVLCYAINNFELFDTHSPSPAIKITES